MPWTDGSTGFAPNLTCWVASWAISFVHNFAETTFRVILRVTLGCCRHPYAILVCESAVPAIVVALTVRALAHRARLATRFFVWRFPSWVACACVGRYDKTLSPDEFTRARQFRHRGASHLLLRTCTPHQVLRTFLQAYRRRCLCAYHIGMAQMRSYSVHDQNSVINQTLFSRLPSSNFYPTFIHDSQHSAWGVMFGQHPMPKS